MKIVQSYGFRTVVLRPTKEAVCIDSMALTGFSYLTALSSVTNAAPRGAVKSLEYSDDGHALAVGWALGGISIWSVFGRLLTNSTSEDTTENYSDDESESLAEEYLSGVQTLVSPTVVSPCSRGLC